MIVGSVQEAIDKGLAKDETGVHATRNTAQIPTLSILLRKINLMQPWEEHEEMKKKHVQRTLFFSSYDFGSGIQKINVQNCGTYLMEKEIW